MLYLYTAPAFFEGSQKIFIYHTIKIIKKNKMLLFVIINTSKRKTCIKNTCSNQLLNYLCGALIKNNTNHEKNYFACTGFGSVDRCFLR